MSERMKDFTCCGSCVSCEQETRKKAINDFCKKLKEKYGCLGWLDETSFEEIDKLAEQMKEVGE